jgi:hypothetical protein
MDVKRIRGNGQFPRGLGLCACEILSRRANCAPL